MAELGRREATPDPLALNAGQRQAQVNLPVYGVRNPNMSGGNSYSKAAVASLGLLSRVSDALVKVQGEQQDAMIVQGKVRYIQGATEDKILEEGDPYQTRGYKAIQASTTANDFLITENEFLANEGADMDKDAYAKRLQEQGQAYIEAAGDDPAVQAVAVAAWEDIAPRLAGQHVKAHNERNREKTMMSAKDGLVSMSVAASDRSQPVRGLNIRATDVPVSAPVAYNPGDKHIAVLTMLGEAAGEDDTGLAAVAHVLLNRAQDGGYGGNTVTNVALAEKQFSTWNSGAGGNDPESKFSKDSAAYQRAAAIWDLVAGGKHIDPTGGATHYYSPKGMKALIDEGAQSHSVPSWWKQEVGKSNGYVKIGGHLFAGKAKGSRSSVKRSAEEGYAEQQANVGEATGVQPVQSIPTAHTGDTNMIRRYFDGLPLRDEDKGTVLAAAIVTQLDAGDDTLLNDVGARALLNEYGAPEEARNRVDKAIERYTKKQESQYDIDYERERSDILDRTAKGEFTKDEAIAKADELAAKYGRGDSEARSLVRQVESDARQATGKEEAIVPIEFRSEAAKAGTRVAQGASTPEEEAENMRKVGKALGVKDSVVDNFMASMFTKAEQRRTELKRELEKNAEDYKKNEAKRGEVDEALAKGYGLGSLKGTIKDDAGNEVPAVQFGINKLRTDISERVNAQGLDPDAAAVQINKTLYEILAKQDVPDEAFGRQLSAAVVGDITDPKTKEISEEALRGMDVYMQLVDNPNVGPEYVSRMLTEEARQMYSAAYVMYDGQMNLGQALAKAHTTLNQPIDVNRTLEKTALFNASMDQAVEKSLGQLTGQDKFWSNLITGNAVSKEDAQAALRLPHNAQLAKQYMQLTAEGRFYANPNLPMGALMKMAQEDLVKNSVIVGGNLIVGKADKGQRLDQVMGLQDLGKESAYRAVEDYLMTIGPKYWPGMWKEEDASRGFDAYVRHDNAYQVTYNPSSMQMEIQLFKDSKREEYKGAPLLIDVRDIGKWYKDKVGTFEPAVPSKVYRTILENIAPRQYTSEEGVQNMLDAQKNWPSN